MTICIHHNDLDGLCSGFLCKAANADVVCYEYDYGKEFPMSKIGKDEIVYILDINPTPEQMQELVQITKRIVWIDHHKSTIQKLPLYQESIEQILGFEENVVIRDGEAACKLTWKYFQNIFQEIYGKEDWGDEQYYFGPMIFTSEDIPLFVEYIHKWDTWKHGDQPEIIAFTKGMSSYDCSVSGYIWKSLIYGSDKVMEDIIARGKIILEYITQRDQIYRNTFGYEREFEGYKLWVCNEGLTSSRFFTEHKESNYKDYDIWVAWVYNGATGQYRVSLYSETVDVSKIVVRFGGGGHKGAAGFLTEELPEWVG